MAVCAQPRFVYFRSLILVLNEGSFILRLKVSLLPPRLEVVPPLSELVPRTAWPPCVQSLEVGGQLRGDQQLPLGPQVINSPPTLRPAPRKYSARRNVHWTIHSLFYPPIIGCFCPLIKINYSRTRRGSFEFFWYFAAYVRILLRLRSILTLPIAIYIRAIFHYR